MRERKSSMALLEPQQKTAADVDVDGRTKSAVVNGMRYNPMLEQVLRSSEPPVTVRSTPQPRRVQYDKD